MPPPSPYVSVRFKDGQEPAGLAFAQQRYGATLTRRNNDLNIVTLKAPKGVTSAFLAQQLSHNPRVLWAEPAQWRRLFDVPAAPLIPDDPFYADHQEWYYDVMNVQDAWELETGKPSAIIAVLDSGVSCDHPDLADAIWVNAGEIPGNGIDDDDNGYVDDVNGFDFVGAGIGSDAETETNTPGDSDPCIRVGNPSMGNGLDDDRDGFADSGVTHGTYVAGIVAGKGNNAIGVAGACWGCKIMPVRMATPEKWLVSADSADAIVYAAKAGAKVINLSFGGPNVSEAERNAISLAVHTYGVLVVAASGNDYQTPISYPARLPEVMAVGSAARTNTKARARFSNWGTGTASNPAVDVVAPGIDLATTGMLSVADQNAGHGNAGEATYRNASGTSFSAPLVSGIAGLLLSRYPGITAQQVRDVLNRTAVPLPDDPADNPNAGPNWAGSGMVNALAAFRAAAVLPIPTQTPTPSATPSATPSVGPTASPTASVSPTVSASATVSPTVSATVTPSGTPSDTITPTPLPANSTPVPINPPSGTALTSMGTTLEWNLPIDATQYQIQVVPFNNDGPAINLIRNVESSYVIQPPVFGVGPYVMLPSITYMWRVRSTTATVSVNESSAGWGPWSPTFTFRTRLAGSAGMVPVTPPENGIVNSLMPVLQWSNTDPNIFYYEVQISKDPTFGEDGAIAMVYWELRHGGATLPQNSYAVPVEFPLEQDVKYFWRIRPRIQGDGTPVPWSRSFNFTTRQ